MTRHDVGQIIELACTAGKAMLENGGEIYRVEETALHICKALGIERCECFATPTTIILSAVDDRSEVYSRMMRISTRGVNLHRVAAVNNLSREIASRALPVAKAWKRLEEINRMPVYGRRHTVLAAALGTGAFTVVFGGSLRYFLAGLFMGAVLRMLTAALGRKGMGEFATNLIGGAAAALGGWLLTGSGVLSEWWIITLASLMLLVPGLLFTNALRDIAAGDLVSGISRGGEALSIAVALACGAAATLQILTRLGGGLIGLGGLG